MKKQSNTIMITSPQSNDNLTTLVRRKIYPPKKRIPQRACELPMARGGRGHSLIPCIRTLLVDDSPFMLKILAQILSAEGRFTVVGSATDGCQALRQTLVLVPELVLVDLHLPHLNGAQVTSYIKHFRNPPVVFMVTSDDRSNSRAMSEAAGADAFIVKSGDLRDQLKAKLQEWFGLAANPYCNTGIKAKADKAITTVASPSPSPRNPEVKNEWPNL
jgi:DNA-binding NarL/FixJ family response regulator